MTTLSIDIFESASNNQIKEAVENSNASPESIEEITFFKMENGNKTVVMVNKKDDATRDHINDILGTSFLTALPCAYNLKTALRKNTINMYGNIICLKPNGDWIIFKGNSHSSIFLG